MMNYVMRDDIGSLLQCKVTYKSTLRIDHVNHLANYLCIRLYLYGYGLIINRVIIKLHPIDIHYTVNNAQS